MQGLWGHMIVKVIKTSKCLGIIIPKRECERQGIQAGDHVSMEVQKIQEPGGAK
jgi:hypothetical protein